MDIEKERQRFETWASTQGWPESDLADKVAEGAPRGGEYRDAHLQELWETWQAALDTPCATRPEHVDGLSDDDLWHIACVVTELNGSSLFNVGYKRCVAEIRAAFMDPDSGRAFLQRTL